MTDEQFERFMYKFTRLVDFYQIVAQCQLGFLDYEGKKLELLNADLTKVSDYESHRCIECGYFWFTDEVSDNDTGTRMLVDCGCSTKPTRPTEPHTRACPDFVLRREVTP